MLIEADSFPIVRIHYDRASLSGVDSLAVFDALLDRNQPFVLIGGGDHIPGEFQEERSRITLWMKRNRKRLHRLVRAMVYVEPNLQKRLAARPTAFVFEKFWGFPMMISESDGEATSVAQHLLTASIV